MLHTQPRIPPGPYRATKLWNEAVGLFQTGMPVRKHRYLLKTYPDTFTGAESIEWLHALLIANPNFGQNVTKEQTTQLLCKFLRNHVIEDIYGRWETEKFSDNNFLYRFPTKVTPSKLIRQPLAMLGNKQLIEQPKTLNNTRGFIERGNVKNAVKVVSNTPLKAPISKLQKLSEPGFLSESDLIHEMWKNSFISKLLRTFHVNTSKEFETTFRLINAEDIIKNATKFPSLSEEHGMPFWVISAMQCLALWPDSEDSNLPCYPGFEKDVFAAVQGYFHALTEPLLTYKFYNLFIRILVRCEMLDKVCRGEDHLNDMTDNTLKIKAKSCQDVVCGNDNVVNKLQRQLDQARMRHENKAAKRSRSIKSRKLDFKSDKNPLNVQVDNDVNYFHSLPRKAEKMSSFYGWNLNETATRKTWMERFNSVQALDALSEEDKSAFTFGYNNIQEQRQNASSLPDIMDCPHNRVISGIEDHSKASVFEDDDVVAGAGYKTYQPKPNVGMYLTGGSIASSVENLLLNMSNDMRDELEEELMASPVKNENEEFNIYDTIKPRFVKDDESPIYRTMKSCKKDTDLQHKELVESPYMIMKKRTEKVLKAQLRSKSSLNVNDCKANENSFSQMNDVVGSLNGYHNKNKNRVRHYGSLPRNPRKMALSTQRPGNFCHFDKPNQSKYKPSHDELEAQLMESMTTCYNEIKNCSDLPSACNSTEYISNLKAHSQYTDNNNVGAENYLEPFVCMQNNDICNYQRKKSSSIVARMEVPPDISHPVDPHKVKSRVMRLPYVSDGMTMSNLHSSVQNQNPRPKNDQKQQPFTRLCRSYSCLSHRRPKMNELGLSNQTCHKSMQLLHPKYKSKQIGSIGMLNSQPDYLTAEKKMLKMGHRNQISEPRLNDDLPKSPLSAAFLNAKKQMCEANATSLKHICEALQLSLLLIPPSNRCKLYLLFRLINKMIRNPHLVDLGEDVTTRAFLIRELTPCILNPEPQSHCQSKDEKTQNKEYAEKLVGIMIDNADVIMKPHESLKEEGQRKTEEIREKKCISKLPGKYKPLQRQMTFCKQIPVEEYMQEKEVHLKTSMSELLLDIINNENMTAKEKKKKLKQFAKCYPEVYREHFPNEEPKLASGPGRRKPLFSNALMKLKGLRM